MFSTDVGARQTPSNQLLLHSRTPGTELLQLLERGRKGLEAMKGHSVLAATHVHPGGTGRAGVRSGASFKIRNDDWVANGHQSPMRAYKHGWFAQVSAANIN